jgi:hypothetical protein
MSQRYLGGIITANPTTPTMTSESGVWTLEQQFQYSSVWSPEIIGNSLRFRQSATAYLSRTYGTPTSTTTGTISFWYKRGLITSGATNLVTVFGTVSTTTGDGPYIQFSLDRLRMVDQSSDLITNAVFRDPSAWYHIVCAIDSTQATASDRVKLYVNGVQYTSFSSATYGSQNYASTLLASGSQYIGYSQPSNARGSDGYMAECYFVDGQALAPTSFGGFDSTGVWQPLAYTGTYGANGFYIDFSDNSSVNALGLDSSGNTSASSTTAPVTLGTDGTGWTGEGIRQVIPASAIIWGGNKCRVKLTGGSSGLTVVGCAIGKKAAAGNAWDFDGNQVTVTFSGSASVSVGANTTVYSDWISFPISSANSYVVGIAISNSGTNTVQRGTNTGFTCYEKVGGYTDATSTAPSGYSSTASNTTLFAGLDLQANNWTPNNFSLTAGTTYDWMLDAPTNSDNGGTGRGNYAVLNPLVSTSGVLSQANLVLSLPGGSTNTGTAASFVMTTGKWYWEVTATGTLAAGDASVGVCDPATSGSPVSNNVNFANNSAIVYPTSGSSQSTRVNGSAGATLTGSFASGNVLMIAFDADAKKIWFGGNGTWFSNGGTGDPAAGTNPSASSIGGSSWWPLTTAIGGTFNSQTQYYNFGQRPFTYTPPTGFKALCTQNLPTPNITNGAKYFAATTYTGNGTSQLEKLFILIFFGKKQGLLQQTTLFTIQIEGRIILLQTLLRQMLQAVLLR